MISDNDLTAIQALYAKLAAEGYIMEVGNKYSLCASFAGISTTPQAEILARRWMLDLQIWG